MDTGTLPGSDARKVALAKLLRERTTVSLDGVPRTLCMGGPANVGRYVRPRPWQRGSWTQLMVENDF